MPSAFSRRFPPVVRATGALAALLSVAVACVSAPFTGGGTTDAGGDAGAVTYCSTQEAALFCDDFDLDRETLGFDRVETTRTATLTVDDTASRSPARSLVATGPAPSRAYGEKSFGGRFAGVDVRFALRLDDFSAKLQDLGGVRFAALSFDTGDITPYVITFNVDGAGVFINEPLRSDRFPVKVVTGTWFDVAIAGAVEASDAASAPLTITITDATTGQSISGDLTWSPPRDHVGVKLEVGVTCGSTLGATEVWKFRYDNVVFRGEKAP